MSEVLKVVMLGDTSVGKTTLVTRWTEDRYEGNSAPTLGAGYKLVPLEMDDGKSYDLHIWDTAGQDEYINTTAIYCHDAKAAMITYDVTRHNTFESIKKWIDVLHDKVDAPVVIVGNKSDLDDMRAVSLEEASKYCQSINAPFFEVSAKTGFGVDDAFGELANVAARSKNSEEEYAITDKPPVVDPKPAPKPNEKKNGCC